MCANVSAMDSTIIEQLRLVEPDFLAAIAADGEAPTRQFQAFWSKFAEQAMTLDCLTEDTDARIHATAARIQILAQSALDVYHKFDSSTTKLLENLEEIFSHLHLHSTTSDPSPVSNPEISLPSLASGSRSKNPMCSTDVGPCPPYIAPAYKWLMRNLHDPYPPSEIKISIARSTGSSVKKINAWFMGVRRRMGWTALCRSHFSNSRSEMVDAAYRALVKLDTKRPLDPPLELKFIQMRSNAQDLYSRKLTKSKLAGKLDAVVKDMTDEDRASLERRKAAEAEEEKRRQHLEKQARKEQRAQEKELVKEEKLRVQSSYPSPDRSIHGTPEPTLVPGDSDEIDEEEDLTPPAPLAGCKRRGSFTLEDCHAQSSRPVRPIKKLRSGESPSNSNPMHGLPSPPSSSCDVPDRSTPSSPIAPPSDPLNTTPLPPQTAPPSPIPNRKRRLSESDVPDNMKRARHLSAVQSISESTLIPGAQCAALDDWPHVNFDFPSAVTYEEPDQSAPLDFEFYTGWQTTLGTSSVPWPVTGHAQSLPSQHIEVPESDLPASTPGEFDISSFSVPAGADINFNLPNHTYAPGLDPLLPELFDCSNLNTGYDPQYQHHTQPSISQSSLLSAQYSPDYSAFFDAFNTNLVAQQTAPPTPQQLPVLDTAVIATQDPAHLDLCLQMLAYPNNCLNTNELQSKANAANNVHLSSFKYGNPSPADLLEQNSGVTNSRDEDEAVKWKKLRACEEEWRRLHAELAVGH